jgi:predicted DNA-binding WGR domain protein
VQTTVKEFSSASEATEAAEKLIKEKTKKGYVEK